MTSWPFYYRSDNERHLTLTKFTDLGLAGPILTAIKAEGYKSPSPIQAQAIPLMLQGKDMVGIAQTGTGKTAAFLLPLLHHLSNQKSRPQPKTCRTLVIAPTRELVAQIAENAKLYGKNVRHSSAVIVGGVKPSSQIRTLARGVDLVIATPGRLLDHMRSGALSLSDTTKIVLDEADQMLDMGFIPAIREIMRALPQARQTVLFSATMPKQIRALADDFLNDPAEVAVAPAAKPIDKIRQSVVLVEKTSKARALGEYIHNNAIERIIIFTRTKHGADKLGKNLDKQGLYAAALHGNKTQSQRKRILQDFKSGRSTILIATDIAARGIDIDGVSHVINYELPNVPESYVHRIGRTARAGRSGTAVSFVSGDERKLLKAIEKLIGRTIHRFELDQTEYAPIPVTEEAAELNQERRAKKQAHRGRGQKQPASSKRARPPRRKAAPAAAGKPGTSPARKQGQKSAGTSRKKPTTSAGKPAARKTTGKPGTPTGSKPAAKAGFAKTAKKRKFSAKPKATKPRGCPSSKSRSRKAARG